MGKRAVRLIAKVLNAILILAFMTGCTDGGSNTPSAVYTPGEGLTMVDILYTTDHDPSLPNNEDIARAPWGANLFSKEPDVFNWDLLIFAAALNATAADGGEGDPHFAEGYYSGKALEQLGFTDIALFSYPDSKYNVSASDCGFGSEDSEYAFSVAHKVMSGDNGDFDLVVAYARGTVTFNEAYFADFLGGMVSVQWVYGYSTYAGYNDYANDMIKGIEYLEDHYRHNFRTGNTVYLICGHSLGGAAANLVAAKFTSEGRKVYGFTFGALNSIDDDANDKCKNIWNCMNYYDTFGPYGSALFKPSNGGSTFFNKYGHVGINRYKYTFTSGDQQYTNHQMKSYYLGACSNRFDFGINASVSTPAPTYAPANTQLLTEVPTYAPEPTPAPDNTPLYVPEGTYISTDGFYQRFTFYGTNGVVMYAFGINGSGTYVIRDGRIIVTYKLFNQEYVWNPTIEFGTDSIIIAGTEFIKE